jgi:hypothetical protein
VLGHLVEAVSGQAYGDYVRDHILAPLGMERSSASPDGYPNLGMARGYSQVFAFPVALRQRIPRYYLPAGFIVSTARDLARYLMAMANGGALDGRRIISESGVRTMLTPASAIGSSAGFGWDIAEYYGEPQVTHGGATERFYTSVLILPKSGLTATMLINQDHMLKATFDYPPLFWGVVDLLTGHPVTTQRTSARAIGWGLLAAFLAVLALSARGLLSLRKERVRQEGLPRPRRWLRLLPHAAWIAATLVVVTVIGPSLAGRGFDLRWFIGFYPDIALIAALVLCAEPIQLGFKVVVILRALPGTMAQAAPPYGLHCARVFAIVPPWPSGRRSLPDRSSRPSTGSPLRCRWRWSGPSRGSPTRGAYCPTAW